MKRRKLEVIITGPTSTRRHHRVLVNEIVDGKGVGVLKTIYKENNIAKEAGELLTKILNKTNEM